LRIDVNPFDVADLARIGHAAPPPALRELVPQVGQGDVRAVFLDQDRNTKLTPTTRPNALER
jgi:hypothetical protein